jgi:hypothetical protein
MGPASISPRAFHGWTRRPPCFSGFAWWIELGPGSFDVKPWSGPVLKKSFGWRAFFRRKSTLTECNPRASCYLEQKVGGSWIFIVGKTENLIWGYVPCSPRAYIRVLFIQEELGYRVFLSYSQVTFLWVVVGNWPLGWLNTAQSRVAQCWHIPLDILSLNIVSSYVVAFPLLLYVTSLNVSSD